MNYACDSSLSYIGIVMSIMLAAPVGVLFSFGLIPAITTAIWIVFGLAVLLLTFLAAGLFITLIFRSSPLTRCLYCRGNYLLAGTVGTIVSALAALSITLITTSVPIIILISIGAFFAALMLMEVIIFFSCIIDELPV
ncbi:MAG: hypothetical protein GXY01_10070 [Clostridiales bacterium]|jgi:hypothetical protein|nr:hypothetical protein [Clostridiales bacterium]